MPSRPHAAPRRPSAGAAWLVLLAACGGAADDRTPEGAVRALVDALARHTAERSASVDAFRLLDPRTRRELGRRAEEASALSGRRFHPWDMLPPGRFRLRFRPRRRDGYTARVAGDTATVVVRGVRPDERAEIPLVREKGRWRVVLSLAPTHPD